MASDPNARISVITGAWAVPLLHSNLNFARIRKIAARHQKSEAAMIELLDEKTARADIRIWSLAEFIEQPMPILQAIVDELTIGNPRRLTEAPHLHDLEGLGQFVQNLRNQGMNPYSVGDLPIELPALPRPRVGKPYLVGE